MRLLASASSLICSSVTGAIQGWQAGQRIADDVPDIPVMVIRGERDFVTGPCVEPWSAWGTGAGVKRKVRMREMKDCGHMCHLEDRPAFLDLVDGFLQEYD